MASIRGKHYLALAISLTLAVLLASFGPEGRIERSLQNLRNTINSKAASGQIHIVEIDAKSILALNHWPWPRSNHAKLIDQLSRAGVEQIVFDVDFSSRSSGKEDGALAAAIARADGKVVLPTFRQPASNGETSAEIENLPIVTLRAGAFLGSVNVRPDMNGQVNTYPFGTITDAISRPSIGALLADTSGSVAQEFRIDQSIEIDTIPRHSFADILKGRFNKAELKGKKIIIGATAIEVGDRYATARFGVVPGVVIQALAAETLIAGQNLPDYGPWPMLLFVLLIAILRIRTTIDHRLTGIALTVIIVITVLTIPLIAERYRFAHLDIAPALLLIACAVIAHYMLGMMQKMVRERRFDRETGLPNLASWQLQRDSRSIVVVAEIANFGEILSTLGEADSRKFILAIVDRLTLPSDAEKLHRLGREQFCWKSGADSSEALETLLQGASILFNAPILVSGRSIRATVCFGIAQGEMIGAAGLANNAALAAKRAGELGVHYMWHDDSLAQDTDQSLIIISEFEEALTNGQISVAYQPKYGVAAERVTSAEALVRWKHPARGAISPAVFVPILERENLMESLTLRVLQQVLGDMEWWDSRGQKIGCAINVSASLLLSSAFVERAIAIVRRSRIDPKLLTFELTETAVLSSVEQAAMALNRFKKLGARLSIDDYGTGQSTLTYLKSFSADEIKVDQSFVKLITTDNANRIMVRSSIEMAHALGIAVVAEGVEDVETLQALADFGCDMIQGWYIGRPVPKEEFFVRWGQVADGHMGVSSLARKVAR
ncbi:MAG: EAL domain-containing protein [Pseudomonadota bacterium]